MDPKEIKAIEDWPTPASVIDIRSFLGLSNYYRKFIDNLLRIDCPMTTFQKKANKFLWTTKCEESFQKIKKKLMTAPILRIGDPDGDFVVCIVASKECLKGFLLQTDYTI